MEAGTERRGSTRGPQNDVGGGPGGGSLKIRGGGRLEDWDRAAPGTGSGGRRGGNGG